MANQCKEHTCKVKKYIQWVTTLSLTRVYLYSFSSCCLSNLRNPAKFSKNSNFSSSRSSKVTDLGASQKCICNLLL